MLATANDTTTMLARYRAAEGDFDGWTTSDIAAMLGFAIDVLGGDARWDDVDDTDDAVTVLVDELIERHESIDCPACDGAGGWREPRGGSRSGRACETCDGEGWLGR